MLPYDKKGFLYFGLSQVRFSTIIPAYRYTYAEANSVLSHPNVVPGSLGDKMQLLMHDLKIIADKNGFKRHNMSSG